MTTSEAEAITMKVWHNARYDGNRVLADGYIPGMTLILSESYKCKFGLSTHLNESHAWLAAFAFTREHMRKIAEKLEERAWIASKISGHDKKCAARGCKAFVVGNRILGAIESEFTLLRRGVRAEYQDGRLEGL